MVVEDLSVRWGDLVLIGNGTLDIGIDGKPSGEMFFEATNWREMVAIAEASGTIGPDKARRITGAVSGSSATLRRVSSTTLPATAATAYFSVWLR